MPQLLLQGFPDGATRIGPTLSVLKKEGRARISLVPTAIFRTARPTPPGNPSGWGNPAAFFRNPHYDFRAPSAPCVYRHFEVAC